MSKTYKEQDTYDYLHSNKEVKGKRLIKLLNFFNRVNYGKWYLERWHNYKIKHRTPIE